MRARGAGGGVQGAAGSVVAGTPCPAAWRASAAWRSPGAVLARCHSVSGWRAPSARARLPPLCAASQPSTGVRPGRRVHVCSRRADACSRAGVSRWRSDQRAHLEVLVLKLVDVLAPEHVARVHRRPIQHATHHLRAAGACACMWSRGQGRREGVGGVGGTPRASGRSRALYRNTRARARLGARPPSAPPPSPLGHPKSQRMHKHAGGKPSDSLTSKLQITSFLYFSKLDMLVTPFLSASAMNSSTGWMSSSPQFCRQRGVGAWCGVVWHGMCGVCLYVLGVCGDVVAPCPAAGRTGTELHLGCAPMPPPDPGQCWLRPVTATFPPPQAATPAHLQAALRHHLLQARLHHVWRKALGVGCKWEWGGGGDARCGGGGGQGEQQWKGGAAASGGCVGVCKVGSRWDGWGAAVAVWGSLQDANSARRRPPPRWRAGKQGQRPP